MAVSDRRQMVPYGFASLANYRRKEGFFLRNFLTTIIETGGPIGVQGVKKHSKLDI